MPQRCEECRYLRLRKQKEASSAKWRRENPEAHRAAIERALEAAKKTPLRKRARMMYSTYRLTLEQFDAMVKKQNGLCAICGLAPLGRGRTDFLVVDHCHDTGRVRALLCGKCNSALGLVDENPETLRAMRAYLKKWA
jgi:hypothetical protein